MTSCKTYTLTSQKRLLLGYSFLIIILIVFSTCKKYPEGGFEVLGPKMLLKRVWTLTLFEVNGIDSTNLINYNGNEGYKECIFGKETIKYNKEEYAEPYRLGRYPLEFTVNNTLTFTNKESDLDSVAIFCRSSSECYRVFLMPEGGRKCSWSIIKLTKKELILTFSKKNNYKLKFKFKSKQK